ncbi:MULTISPECIES: zinc-dependent alcohol dehydrogenase family protein [Bradyrhizobium]|jgi:NADPH:quinone reductase-like Zn-dependent oxidoreductase|uniref:zinc-dependent alcohol dehydrogenase family protein n=1 Tax=Bradyrhizobium TaxID=374 RepID=UPI0004087D95|nr:MULTISPECIES: zinc-dependent alcohol dehydrogenase family protein [Bradyrhizobium]QOG16210.1 zinc-binding dehydrogenase [Bradyrhizobium sp. SEMIA]UFW49536.1 zinc-dependent alcohol dehydrogenase family protein [Bradyrhizobium arachidis]
MARVVRFHEYGDADVLKIEDIEVAAPEVDEVQIVVRAIGLNRAEVMFRRNAYVQQAQFPSRLGYEAAGIVKAVGASVSDFRPGQSVSVIPTEDMARWGTYGEVINIPARNLVVHPKNLTFAQAAASWMKYVTAWGALIEQANLKADDYVIVTAASSSVGTAAFQIARAVGATIIATTRSSAKRKALLDAGAHHVIATAEEDLVSRVMEITSGKGARVVFDPIGGPAIEQLAHAMSHRGILIEYGALSPDMGAFPQFAVLGKSLTIKGYLYNEVVDDDDVLARAKRYISEGLSSGTLKPVISRSFEFDQIQEATRFLESNEQIGKIVVTV